MRMDTRTQNACIELIREYDKETDFHVKCRIRNKLYHILRPYLICWIKERHKKRGEWEDEGSILSLSWDTFLYCLSYYKRDGNFITHFKKYTTFYIISMFNINSSLNRKVVVMEEVDRQVEINEVLYFCGNILNEYVAVKKFKQLVEEKLGGDYIKIFEDALLSMSPYNPYRINREKELKINHYRYIEAKKVFRLIISFLLE